MKNLYVGVQVNVDFILIEILIECTIWALQKEHSKDINVSLNFEFSLIQLSISHTLSITEALRGMKWPKRQQHQ